MATWYVNSAAAGTGAGTSWVNACTTLAAAITLSAAGDDFNVLNTHAETSGSSISWTFNGTAAAPNRVFSCGNTNSPAQASDMLAGASATCTANGSITVLGFAYLFGLSFLLGDATPHIGGVIAGAGVASRLIFDTCTFTSVGNTNTVDVLLPGSTNTGGRVSYFDFVNCTFVVNNAANQIQVTGGMVRFIGGTFFATGTTPTSVFRHAGATPLFSTVVLEGADLSALGAGKTLVTSANTSQYFQFIKCKLGAGVTVASGLVLGGQVDLINCDSGATGYRNESYQYPGTLTTSTAVYNAATDGVTPYSWHVVTTANANRQSPFECFQISRWVAPGTYAATGVQITSATAALTNADVWVEAQVLDNASFPIAGRYTSAPATQLTAGSSLAGGTWDTGGLGNNYKLAVPSFTVAIAGYVRFVVKVAKASLTLNIDPSVTVA